MSLSVGFLGMGMMASALADGIVKASVVKSTTDIVCSDVLQIANEKANEKGYTVVDSNKEVASKVKDAIILAVKPQKITEPCQDIVSTPGDAVIISIAAGISIPTLETLLPGRRVIRIMPNTPCLVGQSAAAFALGSLANDNDRQIVKSIFGSVGLVMEVSEIMLDAVTGLSGSGPAYAFQFIEALSDGGVRCGLPRDISTKLAAQTLKGAAEMVLETGEHPGLLKDRVTSPGWTTIAGVEALEKGGFRAATISAVTSATRRSMQLGGQTAEDIAHRHNL